MASTGGDDHVAASEHEPAHTSATDEAGHDLPRLSDLSLHPGPRSWIDRLPKTPHVELFRNADFGATTLGPISEWGPALRLHAQMVFSDSRAANIYWGPDRIAFYNEEFAPLISEAHPRMMGRSLRDSLPTVWADTTVIFNHAITSGRTVDVDDMCFFVLRQGMLVETYFIGQFIPLRGDSGEIEGFYNTVYESTEQVLHERRRHIVDRIASIPPCPVDETLTLIVEALHGEPRDVPMALLYSYDELVPLASSSLRLRGSVSVSQGHRCALEHANLEADDFGLTPFFRQAKDTGNPVVLDYVDGSLPATGALFDDVAWGGYGEPSRTIVILSLRSGGRLLGFYVQGINARRPYDEVMERSVVDLARQIEARWGSSISAEEAKLRHEMLERRLTDSERRQRIMAQSAPIGMVQVTPEGVMEWANDQFYEITGCPSNKSAISDFADAIAPEDRARMYADLDKLAGGQERLSSELRLIRKWSPPAEELHEGEDAIAVSAWVLTVGFPVMESGKVKLVMGYITDISRQKWAESVQTRNAAAATLAKRRQEEFIDTTSHEMRNPLSAITQLADGIAGSLRDLDGSVPTLEAHKAILQDNVTSANTILACAAHQKRVIDDVLILSRLESEMLSITPVAERPNLVVNNVVRMFSGEVAMCGVKMEAVRDRSYDSLDIDYVLCDTSRLTQILINLLSNAIKFTSPQPERNIAVVYGAQSVQPPQISTSFGALEWVPPAKTGRTNTALPARGDGEDILYLYFCVHDTGPGLTAMEIERLFKRFSQANSRTHIAYGGSGLGLYICRELAEKQGGQVGVASHRGKGSVFAFYIEAMRTQASDLEIRKSSLLPTVPVTMVSDRPGLPRRSSDKSGMISPKSTAGKPLQGRQTPPESRQSAPVLSETLPGQLHILVVEDNVVNQRILAKQLRKAKCTVTVANHGLEALELLKTTDSWREANKPNSGLAADPLGQHVNESRPRIDIILMDWEMPVMNGLDCTKRIRQLEQDGQLTRRLPVIATTANVRQEQIEQALSAGMDSVMPKPFTVSELLDRVRATIGVG